MKQPVDSRLPRVAFDFIVKSDIEVFVWFVVKGRISISSVGALHEAPAFKKLFVPYERALREAPLQV